MTARPISFCLYLGPYSLISRVPCPVELQLQPSRFLLRVLSHPVRPVYFYVACGGVSSVAHLGSCSRADSLRLQVHAASARDWWRTSSVRMAQHEVHLLLPIGKGQPQSQVRDSILRRANGFSHSRLFKFTILGMQLRMHSRTAVPTATPLDLRSMRAV